MVLKIGSCNQILLKSPEIELICGKSPILTVNAYVQRTSMPIVYDLLRRTRIMAAGHPQHRLNEIARRQQAKTAPAQLSKEHLDEVFQKNSRKAFEMNGGHSLSSSRLKNKACNNALIRYKNKKYVFKRFKISDYLTD